MPNIPELKTVLENTVRLDARKAVNYFDNTQHPFGIDETLLRSMCENLGALAFGPGRFVKAAFRLREGNSPEPALSFTAWHQDNLVGSLDQTLIRIGEKQALLLGPLVVSPQYKNTGIGGELMERAIKAARTHNQELILLVGDEPYYARFGFKTVTKGQIELPGPVDPARLLYFELKDGIIKSYNGMARRLS